MNQHERNLIGMAAKMGRKPLPDAERKKRRQIFATDAEYAQLLTLFHQLRTKDTK